MWTWFVIVVVASAGAVTRDQFYPHGKGLDQRLPRGADVASPEVQLNVPIAFYGETYESLFVNNFGVISFRADIPSFMNAEFPLPYPSIAGFYTNVDTSQSGSVFYRETSDPLVLNKAEKSIQDHFVDFYDFKPASAFIATWVEVSYPGTDKKNTFQIAVINNGTESFVELLYPDREIQWIQRETKQSGLPDAKAQAGFIAENGRMYTLRGSGNHQIRNIAVWSNVQEPGKYVFRVGNISEDGNIEVPNMYNETLAEAVEESLTCAQSGPSICHTQARCIDYQQGICCQCNDGYYGNGKSCIRSDVPIRVHGKLNGVVNDVSFNDVDIQAYVVVADGRSYTALSQGPQNIGNSLQLLNVLGGVVGWLFAKPSGTAKNGYQLTGATFKHTADVFFPNTGDRVTINQDYLGHDVFDQITLETDIRGTIPLILNGIKLDLPEYEEQYTIVDTGLIRSESTRTFTNKFTGEQYVARVSQTFTYNPCRSAPPPEEERIPSTLKVSKNYLGYETKDNIVRYGMSNQIAPLGQEDPCIKGRETCGDHSTCIVQGESFACVCESGYTNIYLENTQACVDIDECSAGTHNCDTNAVCYNHDGGFQCRCNPGFDGDGIRCAVVLNCSTLKCDPNAQCVENFGSEAVCVCNPGFEGNGITCWQLPAYGTCQESCHPDASCEFDRNFMSYKCKCRPGYLGDGTYCYLESMIKTTPPPEQPSTYGLSTQTTYGPLHEAEYNDTFVLPSCSINGCVCPPGYSSYLNELNLELCRLNSQPTQVDDFIKCDSDTDCPPNAICSFPPTNSFGKGHCTCPEGYEGDAFECIERTGVNCSCGPFAHCVETPTGDLMCSCDSGYHGDGYTCTASSRCKTDSDCEYHAYCKPDPNSGEYVCQCEVGYIKDANDACVPDGQLCNGAVCVAHAACLYDSELQLNYCGCDSGYTGDGISTCVLEDSTCEITKNCHPDATCILMDTYQCICNEGFNGDGYSCTPENNCRNNPYMCDGHASCLKRSDGFVCECNSGYNGNGTYCQLNPRQSGNFLVASDGATVYKVPFRVSPRYFATPINSAVSQIAVSVDVDCETGKIFWGDVVGNTIKRVSYDGLNLEPFLDTDVLAPEGISIDWSARNIFWTDSRKLTIEVANLDTKIRKVLFQKNGITNPRGIVVHPQRGKIFWSDWNRNAPKIEWANMDGSERGIFLDQSDVKLPNSLAIDWARDRLCYADAGLFSVKCVSIDTLERETIAANCSYPFGLAINGDNFYWSDWKTLKIETFDTLTQVRSPLSIATSARRLYGVTVAPEHCPMSTNVCQYRNGNCMQGELCLPDGRGSRTCAPAN